MYANENHITFNMRNSDIRETKNVFSTEKFWGV